ncbi:MAG: DUF3135 domain-containing protein [Hahellaceae bacterium]|jgi:hypothetical protein|nr:DUF3135 domain-containing protein [Hahellaceae bacterium]
MGDWARKEAVMKKELPEFDVLLDMASKRPEQLEKLRAELIEDIIASAPERLQRRLRGLQFKVDATRQMSRSPMASCIKVSQMMHESLHDLRGALTGLQQMESQPVQSPAVSEVVQPVNTASMAESHTDRHVDSNIVSLFTYRARRGHPAREARV